MELRVSPGQGENANAQSRYGMDASVHLRWWLPPFAAGSLRGVGIAIAGGVMAVVIAAGNSIAI
jgi:hypothetical protein